MAVSVKIDDELKGRVQRLAESRKRSAHWIMREAIEQYVGREEAQASFQAEAQAAWKSYRETGLHLTGEEVRDWLGDWGTEKETEAPACHE
ncbi:CopG family ribbon-helix-helix protein [Mesorhizobium sp. A556]